MRIVAAIEGSHQGALDVAVAETERVAEFVRRYLEEIGAAVASDGPSFRVVEVGIAAVNRKVRVRQGATGPVERIAVAVLAHLESDLDMNLLREEQRS